MKKLMLGTAEQLIKRCASGDEGAFDLLFKKYARPLTFFICQIIHDFDRAQDIFQDTFLKVIKQADKFDEKYRFSTWIYRIALNLSINELRRKQREGSRIVNTQHTNNLDSSLEYLDNLHRRENPHEILERKDMLGKVMKAVDHLPGPKRIAFILKFHQHLSYEEIAGIMECSTGTVKSRIHYAVEHLQVLVGE